MEQFAEFKRRPGIGQVVVRDSMGNPLAIGEFIRLSSTPDDLRIEYRGHASDRLPISRRTSVASWRDWRGSRSPVHSLPR